MTFKTQMCALLTSILIVACANKEDKKDAVDSSGNCTQETIDLFNDIGNKSQLLNATKDSDNATGIKNSCEKLSSLLGNKVCKAKNLKNGVDQKVSLADVKATCEQANEILQKAKEPVMPAPAPGTAPGTAPAPKPVPSPSPRAPVPTPNPTTPGTPPVETPPQKELNLKKGFLLTVKNEAILNEVIKNPQTSSIQLGKLAKDLSAIEGSNGFCLIEGFNSPLTVKNGDLLKMLDTQSKDQYFSAFSLDKKVLINCTKFSSSATVWTSEDLKTIFGDTVEIKELE